MSKLTLGSLFSGSGGFELGAMLSGIQPIWKSEIEPFAIAVTEKRLPKVKHLGDINNIKGNEIEPVDIITFGSPCTDLSIAGKRAGLEGEKSSLFYQAIRIVKEMRKKTNGKYPRFIVWENVCGAFSSNQGEDFRSVLEEICQVKDDSFVIPKPKKWENAGEIVGENFSLSWRVLDAQYWGVPQRRRRIYLVADFGSERASKILFESEGLSRYSHKSFKAWQNATENSRTCFEESSEMLVFDWHHLDGRATEVKSSGQTLTTRYGHNGVDNHFVESHPKTYDVRFTSLGTENSRANVYESHTSRTIDTGGNTPDSNQGGIAVVSVQGSMIGRKDENGPKGSGINKDVSFTLNTVDKHGVAYSSSKNSHFTRASKEVTSTLVATDYKEPPLIAKENYVVRRLTPKECARLQGFPSWWCSNLEMNNPSEDDLKFWRVVFETYRLAMKPNVKAKSEKQIIKWLNNPHSDSAEYKLWGNGCCLPNLIFVLSGIVYVEKVFK